MLSILTTPISGSNPFGENINYDTDFDAVKNEIAKLGGVDFELLEKTSIKILEKKSKDIRVMSFLSWSYLKSGDWERFCDIWDGLGTLVEQNYDALFPDRDRAKQLAFKWLAEERYTSLLEGKKPTEAEYDHIARMLAGLTKIKPVLEQKFPDGSPFPSVLFKFVQQWEKACKPKPKVEAPPPAPVAAPAAGSVAPPPSGQPVTASAPVTPGATAAEPMDTPKQAQAIIRKAALFLAEKENTKMMGYRILRSVRWDLIEKTPPAEGGKTQITGPNPQQRAYFQKLVADKEWKTVIEKVEAAFVSGGNHLWLDLQRMLATACKELGAEYAPLRNALLVETALLLKRVSDIASLSFTDGSPFCDDATKDWLAGDVQSALGSGGSGPTSGGAASDPLVEEQRAVNGLVAAGKLEEALMMVQTSLRSSSSERDNFRRSIIIGQLLLKAKQPDIAMSVLESLDQKIDRHGLDKWDPDLAVEAWAALASAYKVGKVQKAPNVVAAISEKQTTILSKISQIDPGKAFALNK